MAGLEAFDQELRLATASLDPDEVRGALAAFARKSLADVIQEGRGSPRHERFVNGRRGAMEETVQLPGPIVYEFSLWEPIITFALDELQRRSPVKSGKFRKSFIVMASQKIVTDFDAIGPDEEVIITNFQPYIRKAEGGMLGVPRYSIFDGTKRSLARRFGNDGRNSAAFRFDTRWLNIGSGVHPEIPYVLKGGYARSRARWLRNPSKNRTPLHRRKDRDSGTPISYPAIIINQV